MRYYSTQRLIAPGTFPKKGGEEIKIVNFDEKQYVEEISCDAWGYIEYGRELAKEEAEKYELVPENEKLWWGVMTSVRNNGTVVANIVNTVRQAEKPENSSTSTSRRDVYLDWFGNLDEAKQFVEEAKRA